MNSMLIFASLIAVAVAGPMERGLVAPVAVGPAAIENIAPEHVIEIPTANGSPLVQIVVNINPQTGEVTVPSPIVPAPIVIGEAPLPEFQVPGAVNIVDQADIELSPSPVDTPILPGPVNTVDQADAVVVPAPVAIGTPILPSPVIVSTPEIVQPIAVGTPIIPTPVVIAPETLN